MKRMLGILVALMLVLGFAGHGMATMADLEVVRVIYDQTTGLEYASDLGKIGVGNLALGGSGAFSGNNVNLDHAFTPTSVLGATAATDTLKVAYMAVDQTNGYMWLSGTTANRTYNTGNDSNYAAMTGMYAYYGAASSDASKSMTADARSYWIGMNGTGSNVGSFDRFFTSGTGEAAFTYGTLADLNLYYYANPYAPGLSGLNMGTLQVNADGSTTLNPSAVPIPAAVWLLGSGLLGLIGVRRRNA
jgi:hypothetical protein